MISCCSKHGGPRTLRLCTPPALPQDSEQQARAAERKAEEFAGLSVEVRWAHAGLLVLGGAMTPQTGSRMVAAWGRMAPHEGRDRKMRRQSPQDAALPADGVAARFLWKRE